jgi:hypothetical protein
LKDPATLSNSPPAGPVFKPRRQPRQRLQPTEAFAGSGVAHQRLGTITIARHLNQRGERTVSGRLWKARGVAAILRNRA